MDFNKYKKNIIKKELDSSAPAFTYVHTSSHRCKLNKSLVEELKIKSEKKIIKGVEKQVASFQTLFYEEEGKYYMAIGSQIYDDVDIYMIGTKKKGVIHFYSKEIGEHIQKAIKKYEDGTSYTFHTIKYEKSGENKVAVFEIK